MTASEAIHLLAATGSTLATAESLTGGRLAAAITEVPGSSGAYVGGVVTYATELKLGLLGVPESVVEKVGVVSAECAAAMAEGACKLTDATYAMATTGVAGPETQEGKPVGTVYVAVAGRTGTATRALELSGSREEIQVETCRQVVDLLLDVLRREEPGVG